MKFFNRWHCMKSVRVVWKRTTLHHRFILRPPAASVCLDETASCCAAMVYLLKQQVSLVLKFYKLDHNIIKTRRRFQKFNVPKGPKSDTIKSLLENFHLHENINDYCSGEVWCSCAAFIEKNTQVVQQSKWGSGLPFTVLELRLEYNTTHLIKCHSLHLFPYRIQTRQPLGASAINARQTVENVMLYSLDAGEINV